MLPDGRRGGRGPVRRRRVHETLARTRLGAKLNLERSLRVGDKLDGLATVAEVRPENGSTRVAFDLKP